MPNGLLEGPSVARFRTISLTLPFFSAEKKAKGKRYANAAARP
jgi:hypothetical protein